MQTFNVKAATAVFKARDLNDHFTETFCSLLIEGNRCPVVMQADLQHNTVIHWVLILPTK
jgi:hypothetical protein